MPNVLRDQIETRLDRMNTDLRQGYRGNADQLFCDAYFWQEICKLGKKKFEEAQKAMVENGLVEDDETIRDLGVGDHTVESSNNFSLTAKIKEAGMRFDKDKFMAQVSRKFRVALEKLVELSEKDVCKNETKAPLEKKYIEL